MYYNLCSYVLSSCLPMTARAPRERCGVFGALEPHPANTTSAKRECERRLDEKTEMDRIKKWNTHLERYAPELQTRFTALTHEHNKLVQHRNLVLSLGTNPERNLERLISKEGGSIKVLFGCFMFQNGIPKLVKGKGLIQAPLSLSFSELCF